MLPNALTAQPLPEPDEPPSLEVAAPELVATPMREVATHILEGRPLAEIAQTIADHLARLLRAERIAFCLRDKSGKAVPLHLRQIASEPALLAAHLVNRNQVAGRAIPLGQSDYIREVQDDSRLSLERRAALGAAQIHSALIAPLFFPDSVEGSLIVYAEKEREFSAAELAIFQSFADMATFAVAASRQLEQERFIATAQERNRLAREMHDTVAQSLVALSLQIETAETALRSGNALAASDLLASARAIAKKALEDTRRAVAGLGPASLEAMTAAEAIEEEATRFQKEEGVETQFVQSGEPQPLTPDQRSALLRIVQEALTNIRKHAQARRVRIGLQFNDTNVSLIVEDDGVGFDLNAQQTPGPDGGYGLFGMTERARLAGGELKIETTLNWGTRILVNLPYRPASPLPTLPAAPRQAQPPSPAPPIEAASPETPPAPIRVVIADDHVVTRQGLRTMLETSGEIAVIGEASDGMEAAEQTRALRPDLVLMDIQMPNVDGIEGVRLIHAETPELPVVVLTTFVNDETIREALRLGVRGYLLKDAAMADLIASIRAAYRGETVLAGAVSDRLSALAEGRKSEGESLLNERALEVLQLLAQGARNKEIAAQLFLSERTVEYHLSNIFLKLGVSNRTEAVRSALERGLISSQRS